MSITHDKLHVKCNLEIKQITKLEVAHVCNEHVSALICGVVEGSFKTVFKELSGETISVFGIDDVVNPQEIPIFAGLIVDVSMRETGGKFTEVTIYAKSMSYTLDILPKERSFQALENYTDIMDAATQEQSPTIIYYIEDRVTSYPLIQYRETNWAFLKRLASHFNAPLISDMTTGKADVYVGMRHGSFVGDLANIAYAQSLDQKYYSEVGQAEHKAQYNFYTVSVPDVWQIGDYATLGGRKLYVYSREIVLHKEELICTYALGVEQLFRTNIIFNKKLKGTSIAGTVLATEKEQVRLHLHIDEAQEVATAFPYPWKPESGNVMYCMPQVETWAALYFPQADEQFAIAINSIRRNGQVHPELQDPDYRFFTTEHEKQLRVFPQLLDWSTLTDGNRIGFDDACGCRMDSCQTISIQAGGDIALDGRRVEILAPKEISTVKKDIVQSTVLNLCNDVDTIGGTARFTTTAGVGAISRVSPPKMHTKPFDAADIKEELLSAVPVDLGRKSISTFAAASTLFGGAEALRISHKQNLQTGMVDAGGRQAVREVFTWPEK